jgi:hypothetical protein
VLEKVLKRRVTKGFAETYEAVSYKEGYREFYIVYPIEKGNPLLVDYFDLVDMLEEKHILFSVYPMPSDRPEVKELFLKNSPIIKEVIL